MSLDVQPLSNTAGWGGPLLECLLVIARAHQVTATAEQLLAGLPLESSDLTPSLFARAAARAGLASKIAQRPLEQLNPALFPVVLLLQNNNACVLLSLEAGDARVVFPELGDASVNLPLDDLAAQYTGRVIYARPAERYEARAADIGKNANRQHRTGHWFWSVIAQHKYLYRDVLLTALLVNFFALVSPLFVMNV